MNNICDACGEREIVPGLKLGTYPGAQPACQECYDKWVEDCEAEAAQKAADETAELAYHEFYNQIKAVIIAAGFEIDEHHIADTGTHYYYISKDFPDGWLEKSIRVADHSDAYGTSDININTPGGHNLDGIEISQLAERLQEF
jgi:hypothetical protein